ncbi:HD domain-containing phosphohydrolase [Fusibacter bizertensis]
MTDWNSEKKEIADTLNLTILENYIMKLYDIIQVPITLLDAHGSVIFASKWTSVCDNYFRTSSETEKKCIDTCFRIDQQSLNLFTCPNGLKMRKAPILVDNKIIAHLVVSQFLEHEPNISQFSTLAAKMSYDTEAFIEAIKEVPILDEEKLHQIMDFVDEFIIIIHNLIDKQLKSQYLEEEITQGYEELEASYQDISSLNDQLNLLNKSLTTHIEALYESEKKYSFIFDNMSQGVLRYTLTDPLSIHTNPHRVSGPQVLSQDSCALYQYSLVEFNAAIEHQFGLSRDQLIFELTQTSPLLTFIGKKINTTPIFEEIYYHSPHDTYFKIKSEMVIPNEIHVWVTDVTLTHKKLEFQKKQMWDLISTMGKLVEKRDLYTADHQKRVAIVATRMAIELDLSREEVESIYIASLLHDIGKVSIPSEILTKPDKLTSIEYELIKTHVDNGYSILKNIDFELPVAEIINQHHEKIDGSGYPNGLHGDQMLMASKIVAVADVFEAIISHRPYRPSLGIDFAANYLQEESGKLFDDKVVAACIKISNQEEWTLEDIEKHLQYKL